ncbi:response regulator [Crocosphaera chwakensis]|uniref:Response regulatory domain-containing protein n=1 Tax=Crocosphaera chwakensis CCY0110 TaxID=391612 RepID=A3IZ16_9CHRO|nr:response regulator [Crocosphaera chwakensis]EAZ88283.1 hypothetical protein CY0110_14555 [Crocosphaera chwakensis CCY0110]
MKQTKTGEKIEKKESKVQEITNILFVDTEIGTRHLITNYINNNESDSLKAFAAGSVAEAVRILWDNKDNLEIHIIVVSYFLSGRTSGIELIEIIRQLGFKDIPIFMLTRRDVEPELDRAQFWGVRGFFNKTTITSDEIVKKLRRYIKEVMLYEAEIYEEKNRLVKNKSGESQYRFLRWTSPRGKNRGICLGRSDGAFDENEEDFDEE